MQEKKSTSMPWAMLTVAFLMTFATNSPMSSVPPMEHVLKEQLLLTHAQTSLLFTAPIISMVVLSIPAGMLADKLGIRKAAGIGAIIAVIGCLLRGIATDATSLLAFTFIYGTGYALIFPNLPKLVSYCVPKERAGFATGFFTGGAYTGIALPLTITMSVIFPLTNNYQGTFLFWSIPIIVATITWWLVIPEDTPVSTTVETADHSSIPFRQVMQNKTLWILAIVLGFHHFFNWTWVAWAPALMMEKGAGADEASLIASISMWASLVSVLLLSRFSDRLGLRKPFIWGPFIILAIASWGITTTSITMSWLVMFLVGMFHGIRFTTILVLPVELMPRHSVGLASGLVLSISFIGGIVGPWLGGYIFDITGSLSVSFLLIAVVQICGAAIAFRLPETGSKFRLKN
jgi:CP family cyanate transporter-like MFS transporter